jgi:Tol biopolymer transport system component
VSDTNTASDIFLRDRLLGTTVRVSVDSAGSQADEDSYSASISLDGRYVSFVSSATSLVSGDTNGLADVFVRDTASGTTVRASVDMAGNEATGGNNANPTISADGRYVAFDSEADNLVTGDTNIAVDVFRAPAR